MADTAADMPAFFATGHNDGKLHLRIAEREEGKVERAAVNLKRNGVQQVLENHRELFIPSIVNRCSQVLIGQSSERLANISPPHSSHSYPPDQLSVLRQAVCPWAYRAKTGGFHLNVKTQRTFRTRVAEDGVRLTEHDWVITTSVQGQINKSDCESHIDSEALHWLSVVSFRRQLEVVSGLCLAALNTTVTTTHIFQYTFLQIKHLLIQTVVSQQFLLLQPKRGKVKWVCFDVSFNVC